MTGTVMWRIVMTDSGVSGAGLEDVVGADAMVAVYRHDVHKLRGRSHAGAATEFAGVRVNEDVPLGADRDAALLSRPAGEPEQTLAAHESPIRVSLLTGDPVREAGVRDADRAAIRELVRIGDPVAAHEAWVSSSVAAVFNESVFYPYTSVKFHVLLAAALLDNYRAGFEFGDVSLVVADADEVTPHRTVLATDSFTLAVTAEPGGRPAARLGGVPARSFADVWARLPEYPFDVGSAREWRVLDAQLRRIRSWSTALQYIEEFGAAFTSATPVTSSDVLGGETRDV